ncbi:MAG: hypothetical protein QM601_05820, partial [Pseudoxanthomonas sp.]
MPPVDASRGLPPPADPDRYAPWIAASVTLAILLALGWLVFQVPLPNLLPQTHLTRTQLSFLARAVQAAPAPPQVPVVAPRTRPPQAAARPQP